MKGILKLNEPLAPYTSWHIGGPADKYYRPVDTADLIQFLATLESNEPITWLGLGSNVLIHDDGIRGAVIHTLGTAGTNAISVVTKDIFNLDNFEIDKQENKKRDKNKVIIRAEAGVTCAKLAKYCAKSGLLGGEFFAGIPGTVGGALAMNAGAWGGETWKIVKGVEVINRQGKIIKRVAENYKTNYRSVQLIENKAIQNQEKEKIKYLEEEWFSAGYFEFEKGDSTLASKKIKMLLQERTAKQPIGVFSCGSVFKNPMGDHAGRLIEASGLKGFTIGDAQVSPKHANFILNLGNARAADVLQLIKHIQTVVLKDHRIHLEPEVRMLGF